MFDAIKKIFQPTPTPKPASAPTPSQPSLPFVPSKPSPFVPTPTAPAKPTTPSTPAVKKDTGLGGTYNPRTGIYTSVTGEKQSTASAPPMATIIGGTPLQRTYTGGGGRAITPVSPTPSVDVTLGTTDIHGVYRGALQPGTKPSVSGVYETPTGLISYQAPQEKKWLQAGDVTQYPLGMFDPRYLSAASQVFVAKGVPAIGTAAVEYGKGYISEFKEHPYKVGLTTAAFFVVPPIIKGIGWGAEAVGITGLALKYPLATKIVSKGIGYGLTTTYAGVTSYRIVTAEKPAETFGKITAGEITPMIVGGYAGAKFWGRASTWFQKGGTKLELKEITPPEYYTKIKAGKIEIPTAPIEKHYEMFVSKEYAPSEVSKPVGYHLYGQRLVGTYKVAGKEYLKILTTEELQTMGLKVKPREAVGMYIAPYPSLQFGRMGGATQFYGGELSAYQIPRGLIVEPKGFKIAPIITKEGIRRIAVPKGYAGVSGIFTGKTEPQAIVPEESIAQFTGKKYYFWYKGYKVVLPEVRTIGKETAIASTIKSIEKTTSTSYYGEGKAYVTTPVSYGLGLGISTKPSVSVTPSKYIPSLISVTPSSVTPSIPSKHIPPSISPYVPPYITPSKRPSVPSYVPSLVLPYIPPSKSLYVPPSISSYIPPYIPPSKFPSFDIETTAGVRRIGGRMKFKYAPSYYAYAFGIKGRPTRPTIGGKYTGLEIRKIPIISGGRRVGRRKKKR